MTISEIIDCPRCAARLAHIEDFAVGNNARESMGHAMYFTASGRTALCAAETECTCDSHESKIACEHGGWACLCCGNHIAKPANHEHA